MTNPGAIHFLSNHEAGRSSQYDKCENTTTFSLYKPKSFKNRFTAKLEAFMQQNISLMQTQIKIYCVRNLFLSYCEGRFRDVDDFASQYDRMIDKIGVTTSNLSYCEEHLTNSHNFILTI